MNKKLYYLIMCLTWFVGYFVHGLLLDLCLVLINFIMQEDFYNTNKFATFRTCEFFIILNPFCIVCYAQSSFLRDRFRNIILFSIVSALLFLGLYVIWSELNNLNPSHKAYVLSLAFLLNLSAFIKLYFLYRNKFLECATIMICEFSFIFITGIMTALRRV